MPKGGAAARASAKLAPFTDASPVTPNDGADLPDGPCRAIKVTTAGNVVLRTVDNPTTNVTIPMAAAEKLDLCVVRILATSTTAGGIVALY